jgi:hypothetical protein
LPHRPKKGDWEAKWTAEGQYNEGHWRNRKFIERCPHEYWYSLYRKEVRKLMEKAPWATIHFLNLNGRRLKHESL